MMKPAELIRIRNKLKMSTLELATAIRLSPDNGDRTIRRWENGEVVIPGPASLALEYLEKLHD